MDVGRGRVVAYRVGATGLAGRVDASAAGLSVLDLGVQDTPYGSARVALGARTSAAVDDRTLDGDGLVLVWAARGAPHLHRRDDVPAVARALWPLDDADATTRIANPRIAEGAPLGRAAFTAAAEAMREVVTGPMPKGEVSTGVSARVPASLTFDCGPCGARHISGALFQQVGAAAGVRVVPRGRATELAPLDGRAAVPEAASGTADLIRTYLRLLGPATPAEAAAYLGTTRARVAPAWPDDLVEVRVDGRRAWLPADRVDALLAAPPLDAVRLITARDPLLQARDRDVLVPDRARQKALWTAISAPGAVLANGEIAGIWRARAKSRELEITVTPFAPLPRATATALESEAQVVATTRGLPSATLTITDPT